MAQQTLQINLSLVIGAMLSLVTTQLPAGVVGQAYSFQLQADGGTPPYAFSATGLPAGLSMSASGLLSGTPSAAGTFNVVVTIADAGV